MRPLKKTKWCQREGAPTKSLHERRSKTLGPVAECTKSRDSLPLRRQLSPLAAPIPRFLRPQDVRLPYDHKSLANGNFLCDKNGQRSFPLRKFPAVPECCGEKSLAKAMRDFDALSPGAPEVERRTAAHKYIVVFGRSLADRPKSHLKAPRPSEKQCCDTAEGPKV